MDTTFGLRAHKMSAFAFSLHAYHFAVMTGAGEPPPIRIVRDEDDGAAETTSHHVFARVSNESSMILAAVLNEALQLSDDMGNDDDSYDGPEPQMVGDNVAHSSGVLNITTTTTTQQQQPEDEQPEELATESADAAAARGSSPTRSATTGLVANVSGEPRRTAGVAESQTGDKDTSSPPILRNDHITPQPRHS